MKKIIIFKTDRIGDFINFSPCLRIIKDNLKNCEITMICSDYNYQIVKNYKEIDKIYIIKKKIYIDFFFIVKNFINKKFDYLFQMDGSKKSYFYSIFINAKLKSTIFFLKKTKFGTFSYNSIRPSFFIRKFFQNYIYCNEDYNIINDETHYQKIYFKLLEKIKFDISHKQNIFYLDEKSKIDFNKIIKKFNKPFYLFHLDRKSNSLNSFQFNSLINLIKKIKIKHNVILTLGIGDLRYKNILYDNFKIYDYSEFQNDLDFNNFNIIGLRKLPLNVLAYFIANAEANISMHSGSVIHISAAFSKLIIDVLESHKNNEIDRWVPIISKYRRLNLDQLNDIEI